MKYDKSLKIENLENELFIEELGQVHGGSQSSSSLAGAEEPGWDDTPSQPVFPSPGNVSIDELLDWYRNLPVLPNNPVQPIAITTFMSGGEE